MEKSSNNPRVGVGVFIFNEGKLLMGKRLSAHGKGLWALPGGHLEWGETIEECAKREALEEVNLSLSNLKAGPCTNDIFKESEKHYITCFMLTDSFEGSLKNMEPDKCAKWEWFDLDNLPSPLFLPMTELFKTTSIKKLYSKFFKSHKIAYLACPFAHEDKNVMMKRKDIVTQVSAELHKRDMYVFSPLTHNSPLIDLGVEQTWEKWSKFDLSMLMRCEALYVLKLEGWKKSRGVQAEIDIAISYGIPIIELEYDMEGDKLHIPEESLKSYSISST